MTYQEFKSLPDSSKIVLFEIDQAKTLTEDLWIKFEPGIWMLKYAWSPDTRDFSYGLGAWGFGPYGSFEDDLALPISPNSIVLKVSSVLANSEQLTENQTIENLRLNINSFYWDGVNQTIYINTGSKAPNYVYSTIELGITKGFSNYGGFFGNLYYEPRVKSLPQISTQRDSLFWGKISFEGGSISLINNDGFFDNFGDQNYYGAECRIYFGSPDGEFAIQYTAYIEDYSFTSFDISINFKDNRKLLSVKLPNNYYSIDDYPYLDDGNEGKPKPLPYGPIRKGLATCLNETQTTSTYTFNISDTSNHPITSIDKVYVDNKSVSFSNVNLTNGTFTLSSSVYEPGDDVSVDFFGYNITGALDIIKDLIVNHTNVLYNSSFFNTVSWSSFTIPQVLGLWIGEKTELIDIIGSISQSVFGLFIVDPDGRFNFKLLDNSAASVDTIYIDNILSPVDIELKSDEYLSSVRVGYNQIIELDDYSWYTNTTKETELFNKYRSKVEMDFETLLTDKDDVIDYSTEILNTFGGIYPTYSITTNIEFVDVLVGDNVDLQVSKDGFVKCTVLGKSLDFNNYSINFTLRYLETLTPNTSVIGLIRFNKSGG